MFENLITIDKTSHHENLINQVVKVLAGKGSNPATLKFISQLQTGKVFDAVFTGKTPEGKGILSLKGNKVIVELPKAIPFEEEQKPGQSTRPPLNKGQAIKIRVESLGPKPALKIISPSLHQEPADNPETKTNLTHRGKSISRLSRFEVSPQATESNKSVTYTHTSHILDSKSVLVNARNLAVPVENTELLKPGKQDHISFEKTENGQTPTLVDKSNNSARKIDFNDLKPYLPARMPVAKMAQLLTDDILESPAMQELKVKPEVIARLRDTLQLLVSREGEIPSESQVRQQVESSGINYEAKVRQALETDQPIHKELARDLKGLLLELHQSPSKVHKEVITKTTVSIQEFRQTVKLAIDNIELNQLSTQISKQESQPVVIQIPNPLSSGNKTIQLYVRKESSDEETESTDKQGKHNVAFFLDLSFLGKIKINAQIGQERLSVRIDAENEDIANFISERTDNFKKKMDAHDIETSVECCVTEKVKPAKDSLIELLVNQNTSLVNIKT